MIDLSADVAEMFADLPVHEQDLWYRLRPSRSPIWRSALRQAQLRREERLTDSYRRWQRATRACAMCGRPINPTRQSDRTGRYLQFCRRKCAIDWDRPCVRGPRDAARRQIAQYLGVSIWALDRLELRLVQQREAP